jgi:hypothetical protein
MRASAYCSSACDIAGAASCSVAIRFGWTVKPSAASARTTAGTPRRSLIRRRRIDVPEDCRFTVSSCVRRCRRSSAFIDSGETVDATSTTTSFGT